MIDLIRHRAQRALVALLTDPTAYRILVLKSSVRFRADFDPLAAETSVVLWPGHNPADPTACRYTKLRSRVRLLPAGLRGTSAMSP